MAGGAIITDGYEGDTGEVTNIPEEEDGKQVWQILIK